MEDKDMLSWKEGLNRKKATRLLWWIVDDNVWISIHMKGIYTCFCLFLFLWRVCFCSSFHHLNFNPKRVEKWKIISSLGYSHLKIAFSSWKSNKVLSWIQFTAPTAGGVSGGPRGEDDILVSKIDSVGDTVIWIKWNCWRRKKVI